ncbi:hypothetical protein [Reticulibacter mediterranei]|uniref:hypothetical protein n=1 Tax=Reticulibacter mediterranei TaxID=2778369 RepID=UPI001C68F0B9|nr:hypothetical protein [Reticulibacter mediterranei]
MSHPGRFLCGSRIPQRLRPFVLTEEWMVVGVGCTHTNHHPLLSQRAAGRRAVRAEGTAKNVRDDS